MKVLPTEISDVLIIEPQAYEDGRGFFLESFNLRRFHALTGLHPFFVQDNHSKSSIGVLRGLHYQIRQAQGKLVRAVVGEVFDVAVDIRRGSPSFGRWVGVRLSAENKRQVWVPPGFAHGFLVLSDVAEIFYKATDYYSPKDERTLAWDDPDLAISWPLTRSPVLSDKDRFGSLLREAEVHSWEGGGAPKALGAGGVTA